MTVLMMLTIVIVHVAVTAVFIVVIGGLYEAIVNKKSLKDLDTYFIWFHNNLKFVISQVLTIITAIVLSGAFNSY